MTQLFFKTVDIPHSKFGIWLNAYWWSSCPYGQVLIAHVQYDAQSGGVSHARQGTHLPAVMIIGMFTFVSLLSPKDGLAAPVTTKLCFSKESAVSQGPITGSVRRIRGRKMGRGGGARRRTRPTQTHIFCAKR